jgi:hypothetical protein
MCRARQPHRDRLGFRVPSVVLGPAGMAPGNGGTRGARPSGGRTPAAAGHAGPSLGVLRRAGLARFTLGGCIRAVAKGGKAMSEVAKLRNDHPHWHIDTVWACAGSGPDRRGLRASRAGVTVRAWTAQALARRIAEENRRLATRN